MFLSEPFIHNVTEWVSAPDHICAVGITPASANGFELKLKKVVVTDAADPCSEISMKNSLQI